MKIKYVSGVSGVTRVYVMKNKSYRIRETSVKYFISCGVAAAPDPFWILNIKKRFPEISLEDQCTVVWRRHTLQRQFHLHIPFLGIAQPQPQFPHSCVFERFIYSQDKSTYFLQQNRQNHRGNMYIICSQTHECGNWDWGPDIPFLGIFVSNVRHFVFAVHWGYRTPPEIRW